MKTANSMLGLALLLVVSPILAESPAEDKPVALEVSIAVPLRDGKRLIAIGPGQHFHVVLTNRYNKPLRLWTSDCSNGYDSLTFEIVNDKGTWPIRRVGRDWTANVPSTAELQPGEHWVLDISFQPEDWEVPQGAVGRSGPVKMRAIYQNESPGSVWNGKAVSSWTEYTIQGRR